MTERAAHRVDHVFPVLSLPYRLRYRLAWDHDLCRAVVAVYLRAVLGWLRRRARLDDVADGRGGAVAVLQRFGGALNLNVHIHALVLDGVFAKDGAGALVFQPYVNLHTPLMLPIVRDAAAGRAALLGRVFRLRQHQGRTRAQQVPRRERHRAVGVLQLRLHTAIGRLASPTGQSL